MIDVEFLISSNERLNSFPLTPGKKFWDREGCYEWARDTSGLEKEFFYLRKQVSSFGAACFNLWVVDLDVKGENGVEVMSGLTQKFGRIACKHWISKTPSGGYHVWFALPTEDQLSRHPSVAKAGANLLPGVDLRTGASHVVYPGSSINSGTYRWVLGYSPEDCDLDSPPDWLVAALDTRAAPRKHPRVAGRQGLGPTDVDGLLRTRSFRPGELGNGGRNAGILRQACGLMRINQLNGGDAGIAGDLVLEMNRRIEEPLPAREVDLLVRQVAKFCSKHLT